MLVHGIIQIHRADAERGAFLLPTRSRVYQPNSILAQSPALLRDRKTPPHLPDGVGNRSESNAGFCVLGKVMAKKGFVYLCCPVGHNVYKIGETIDIPKRFARKEKQVDFKLELIAFIEVDRDIQWSVENTLHNMYSRYRLGSEWFVLPKEVVDNFKSIASRVAEQIKRINILQENYGKQ